MAETQNEDAPSSPTWLPLRACGREQPTDALELDRTPVAGIRVALRDSRPLHVRSPNALRAGHLLVMALHRRSDRGDDGAATAWPAAFLGASNDLYRIILEFVPYWGANARLLAWVRDSVADPLTLLRFPPGFGAWEWIAGPETGDPLWVNQAADTQFFLRVNPPHDPKSGVAWHVSVLSTGSAPSGRCWGVAPRPAWQPSSSSYTTTTLVYDGSCLSAAPLPPPHLQRFDGS